MSTVQPAQYPWYIAWKLEERDGAKTKVPYLTATKKADVWSSGPFLEQDAATALATSDGFAGIGVVFSPAHEIVGVDLDGCRDPVSGQLTPWAQQIVDQLNSLTTVTPSRTGVRVWLRAPKDPKGPRKRKWSQATWTAPSGVTKAPGIEVFLTGGFCTIPPEGLDGNKVHSRPAELAALLATAPAPAARVQVVNVPPRCTDLSDDEVLDVLRAINPKAYHKFYVAGWDRGDEGQIVRTRPLAGRSTGGCPRRRRGPR